ncbi:hypothetical protein BGZ72_000745 [Mortierella alpina]|nr:hypothetical protein BGZ72_000745 [Mortierella alpina]
MSLRTIHSVVEIPELVACIARYLSCSDVARAMATCRAWSQQLHPFLWRHLCPGPIKLSAPLLRDHLPLLRTADLRIESYGLVKVLAHGLPIPPGCVSASDAPTHLTAQKSADARTSCCTKLRRIEIDTDHRHEIRGQGPSWPHLVTLLHHSHRLTHLDVSVIRAEPSEPFLHQFLNVLPVLRRLQHFTFSVGVVEQPKFLRMLRACLLLPQLSELYFEFSVADFEGNGQGMFLPELETIIKDAVTARTLDGSAGTKIKALKLPNLCRSNSDVLVLAILRSGLLELETFELPTIFSDQTPAYYRNFVREHCRALRHLVLPVCSIANDDGEMACNFVRGATELKTIRGVLPSVDLGCLSTSHVIRTVLESHSRTLEEMEIERGDTIRSGDQQTILTSCLQLKRLWLAPHLKSKPEGGLQFQDILGGAWTCLGLRELCLTLDRTIDVESVLQTMRQETLVSSTDQLATRRTDFEKLEKDDVGQSFRDNEENEDEDEGDQDKRRAFAWAAKRAYSQIGRLVNLQVLALGVVKSGHFPEESSHSEWDLTLSKGWLAELMGLKNLRELHLKTDYWSKMGQAEVEFMDVHWPFLSRVTFQSEHKLKELVDQPHWRWLRERRPDLKYLCE